MTRNIRGPFRDTGDGRIDCEIEIDGVWHPFTADEQDAVPHGREIFKTIKEKHQDKIQPPRGPGVVPPRRPVNPGPKKGSHELDGLGRLLSVDDPRTADFPLEAPKKARTFRNWLVPGGPWDQGPTPHCVAYAGLGLLTAHPVSNAQLHVMTLYDECQKQDQWPGEEYDGTSVLGLMRVLKARGLVSEYRWTTSADVVMAHVLEHGPVVIGVTWHRDMFTPTGHGYITPTGPAEGGHAVLIVGANATRQNPDGTTGALRILNSWGGGWGEGGRAWITRDDLDRLLKDRGEAAAVTEVRAR